MEGAGRSLSSCDFSTKTSGTRRKCVGLDQQMLFETPIVWEHFERLSGRIANSEHETPTSGHAEALRGISEWGAIDNYWSQWYWDPVLFLTNHTSVTFSLLCVLDSSPLVLLSFLVWRLIFTIYAAFSVCNLAWILSRLQLSSFCPCTLVYSGRQLLCFYLTADPLGLGLVSFVDCLVIAFYHYQLLFRNSHPVFDASITPVLFSTTPK